jgi:hypothetical protein
MNSVDHVSTRRIGIMVLGKQGNEVMGRIFDVG